MPKPSVGRQSQALRRGLKQPFALDRLHRGIREPGPPLVFLDLDDVLCTGKPYGGYEVFQRFDDPPADLWERLWHPPAAHALLELMREHRPQVVMTTSWLRLMERDGFVQLFRRTGLGIVAEAFHTAWQATQDAGSTRHAAIETWLIAHYAGEPFVVLDDVLSGSGLRGSRLDKAGCVVLCEVGVGLHAGHLPAVARALRTPE